MAKSYVDKADAFGAKVKGCNDILNECITEINDILKNVKIDIDEEDALAIFTNNIVKQLELNFVNIISNNDSDIKNVKSNAVRLDNSRQEITVNGTQ